MGAMGGAALLLPREALPDVRKVVSDEYIDEAYIDECYELGPEQVKALMGRIRQLEQMVAQPTFFNGRHGRDGRDGLQGPQGLTGDSGIHTFHSREFEQKVSEILSQQPSPTFMPTGDGSFVFTDSNGWSTEVACQSNTVEVTDCYGGQPSFDDELYLNYRDLYGDRQRHYLGKDLHELEERCAQQQDLIDFLLARVGATDGELT